jgi:UDPglucose 6-dehydrogenase
VRIAQEHGAPSRLVEAVVAVNDARKAGMAARIVAACGGSVRGRTIGILGLTFKPNTDDMRDAPSLVILPELARRGVKVQAHDPVGMAEARKLMPDLHYFDDVYDAIAGADAVVILTEWNSYRALDLGRLKSLLRSPNIVDLRNIYRPEEMEKLGYMYTSLGRPQAIPGTPATVSYDLREAAAR